jgi:hypothetical protein
MITIKHIILINFYSINHGCSSQNVSLRVNDKTNKRLREKKHL